MRDRCCDLVRIVSTRPLGHHRGSDPREPCHAKRPSTDLSPAEQALRDAALEYHRVAPREKISVAPTKPLSNQRDLSLAYLPGVAYACLAIEADSTLTGSANLLVLPNLDSANILFNVPKMTGGHGVTVGPSLLGVNAPAHVLTPSATVRRVVNMTAPTTAHAAALATRRNAA